MFFLLRFLIEEVDKILTLPNDVYMHA